MNLIFRYKLFHQHECRQVRDRKSKRIVRRHAQRATPLFCRAVTVHDFEARRGASQLPGRGHRLQRRPPFSDLRTRQRGIAALNPFAEMNQLYYGDNLQVLREHIAAEAPFLIRNAAFQTRKAPVQVRKAAVQVGK